MIKNYLLQVKTATSDYIPADTIVDEFEISVEETTIVDTRNVYTQLFNSSSGSGELVITSTEQTSTRSIANGAASSAAAAQSSANSAQSTANAASSAASSAQSTADNAMAGVMP